MIHEGTDSTRNVIKYAARMNVFIGRIDHAPESKLAPTFAREESPEKKEKFAPITKFLIGASYIHHEVLDCFPFFCCLSFLELVNSGSHTIRQTLDCETIRELDCPFFVNASATFASR